MFHETYLARCRLPTKGGHCLRCGLLVQYRLCHVSETGEPPQVRSDQDGRRRGQGARGPHAVQQLPVYTVSLHKI